MLVHSGLTGESRTGVFSYHVQSKVQEDLFSHVNVWEYSVRILHNESWNKPAKPWATFLGRIKSYESWNIEINSDNTTVLCFWTLLSSYCCDVKGNCWDILFFSYSSLKTKVVYFLRCIWQWKLTLVTFNLVVVLLYQGSSFFLKIPQLLLPGQKEHRATVVNDMIQTTTNEPDFLRQVTT